MHVTLVEINVKQDKIDEFIDVFRANHLGQSKSRATCASTCCRTNRFRRGFTSTKPIATSRRWRHKQTPHYLQCVEKLEALMTGPRKKTTFIGLMPE